MRQTKDEFNIGTQKLVKLSGDYKVFMGKLSLPYMVEKLRNAISDDKLNIIMFGDEIKNFGNGFCLSASYYIMKNTGGEEVWTLMSGPLHWWLVHKSSGKIFDITYDQWSMYDYSKGKIETRIGKSKLFTNEIQKQSMFLAKYSGLE
jgi:hypothetical protein